MDFKIVVLAFCLYWMSVSGTKSALPKCPCGDSKMCAPVDTWKSSKKEVIVTTSHYSNHEQWLWESFTAVLEDVPAGSHKPELMCHTHMKNLKFGFIEKVPVFTNINNTDFNKFTTNLTLDVQQRYADIVALDFLDLVGSCDYASGHVKDISDVIKATINATKAGRPHVTAICIMPWKPPCFENNCGLASAIAPYCDAVMTNPESYVKYCRQGCIARATVPLPMLNMGVDEWLSSGLMSDQLVIGIPWHGYKYQCSDYKAFENNRHVICYMDSENPSTNKTQCDLTKSRSKLQLGSFFYNHSSLYDTNDYSRGDQAPFYLDKATKTLIWFEDLGSLRVKYRVATQYELKGVAIYTGDDLTYSKVGEGSDEHFNSHMWSWLLHSILSTGKEKVVKKEYNVAGTIAGVGVGMFVFGCLLGLILTCIALRKKRVLKRPFRKDTMHDEYHDDEDNAL